MKGRKKKRMPQASVALLLVLQGCIFLLLCLELSLQRGSLLIHLKTGADLY